MKEEDTTHDAVKKQFGEIINTLNIKLGDDDFYLGTFANVPLLMKLTTLDSSGYFVKLRMTAQQDFKTNWSDQLPPKFTHAKIECEIDNSYIFLWIYSTSFNAVAIIDIIKSCIDYHSHLFPQGPNYCFDCGGYGAASITQSHASISAVCPPCFEIRSQTWRAKQESLNKSTWPLLILIPPAICFGSVGWAAFWILHDTIFLALNTKHILAPRIVVVLFVLGVGYCLGWPVGKILHRSGAVKCVSPLVLSVLVAILTFVVGQFLYTEYLFYQVIGVWDFSYVLSNFLQLTFSSGVVDIAYKVGLVAILAATIFEISKPKSTKLEI